MKTTSRPDSQIRESSPSPRPDLHERICRRAEEIYIRNGRIPGRDLENWTQAEQEILRESAACPTRRTAIVVTVHGVKYVGEYTPDSSGGYSPGEFTKGVPVPVRFEGEKMFVKRPNGAELETTIVQKLG
jgi:hypothetical protein